MSTIKWSSASAHHARRGAMSVQIAGSAILLAGGIDAKSGVMTDRLELWDPVDGHWSAAGTLLRPRTSGVLISLGAGQVLITGGHGQDGTLLATTELWSRTTGLCEETGAMTLAREGHAAVFSYQNAQVLVCGGSIADGTLTATAEIWKRADRAWKPTFTMLTARRDHTVTCFWNRTALVAGGRVEGNAATASCEIWDVAPGAWVAAAPLVQPCAAHQAIELRGENKALVWSGHLAEIVGAQRSATVTPSLGQPTVASFLLEDGRVLGIASDDGVVRPFLFDPRRDEHAWLSAWESAGATFPVAAWLLGDGRIAVLCEVPERPPCMFVTDDAVTLGKLPSHLTALAFHRSDRADALAAELSMAVAERLRHVPASEIVSELRELGHPMRNFDGRETYCYDWDDRHLLRNRNLVVAFSDPESAREDGATELLELTYSRTP